MSVMDDKFYTFEEAHRLDTELFRLATYETTGGMAIYVSSPVVAMEAQKKVSDTYNYFKRLIQTGEATIAQLTQQVLQKNGPFQSSEKTVNEQNIDEILNDADDSYAQCQLIEENTKNQLALERANNLFMSFVMSKAQQIKESEGSEGVTFMNLKDMGFEDVEDLENPEDSDIEE